MLSKGMLNATYGMACTSPIREINNYEDETGWLDPEQPDIETALEKYNKKFSRFDFYCWSIYVTAYSRRNLFTAIVEAGEDYVYSDTDSIKLKNADQHKDYFDNYNKSIIAKLEYALNQQGIQLDYIRPKTIKGVEKPLGVWDYEGTFRIKTLGAKRYMIEENGELSMTVSGINKHLALPYLKKKYKTNDKIFAAFKNGFYIPPGFSGKSTHTYIDDIRAGVITDYQGTKAAYEEKTGIHLEEAEYKLSLSGDFVSYLIAIAKGV